MAECFHAGVRLDRFFVSAILSVSSRLLYLFVGFVFVDDAGLHDEGDVLEEPDVFERVAVDGDDVGPLAGFDGADAVGPAHEVCGVDGAGLDALQAATCRTD